MKEIIGCSKCGMSNLVVIDMILPSVSATFVCTSCKTAWILTGDTELREDKNWDTSGY